MIDDSILAVLFIFFGLMLLCWAGHRIWKSVNEPEPETHGDDGGRPPEAYRRAALTVMHRKAE